ncbi:hypothetical protein SAMN04488057_103298 [Cyclobacterium lianum]|uniref:Lipoprotein n=1 Tax=Cyclobacterium lianum TaxID=388280 RepID=A0A1M7LK28_9BACT|nr:hypothetical protein [Cyclobacterium lianum]SHM77940.1 hypothetical protein SAMN04488057_103298 [Cyclobacterium lianum]
MKYSCSFLYLTFICAFVLFSCTSKLDAGNIDLEAWKKDRDGCLGLRLQHTEELQRIKNTFLAKYNQEIIKTFGRPDRVELVDKSQSFFIYFLEPSDECGLKMEKEPLKVLFRLNAISKVSEVTITSLNP